MSLYNVSINLKGLKYISESPGFIPLLWWLLSGEERGLPPWVFSSSLGACASVAGGSCKVGMAGPRVLAFFQRKLSNYRAQWGARLFLVLLLEYCSQL